MNEFVLLACGVTVVGIGAIWIAVTSSAKTALRVDRLMPADENEDLNPEGHVSPLTPDMSLAEFRERNRLRIPAKPDNWDEAKLGSWSDAYARTVPPEAWAAGNAAMTAPWDKPGGIVQVTPDQLAQLRAERGMVQIPAGETMRKAPMAFWDGTGFCRVDEMPRNLSQGGESDTSLAARGTDGWRGTGYAGAPIFDHDAQDGGAPIQAQRLRYEGLTTPRLRVVDGHIGDPHWNGEARAPLMPPDRPTGPEAA